MPGWLKVLLIIFVMGIVLVAVAIYLGVRWVQKNKDQLREQAQAIVTEAENFGRGKDTNVCVAESISRLRRCGGFICEAKTQIFLDNCARVSNMPPGFCDGVPKRSELLASAKWALEECARRGMPNHQPCTRLMGSLQQRCENN